MRVEGWNDLHQMVTAACYSPDGQVAMVGSHKGSCHLFDITAVCSRKLLGSHDHYCRFTNPCCYMATSLFTNSKGSSLLRSQISAAAAAPKGKCVVCASDESDVYVWGLET